MSQAVDNRAFNRGVMRRLQNLALRLRAYLAIDGLAVLLLALLAAVLVTFAVDRTFRLTWDMRLVQLLSLLVFLGGVAWWWLIRPLSRGVRPRDMAVLVEQRYPVLQNRLVSAVEFTEWTHSAGSGRRESRLPRASDRMMAAVIDQAESAAADLPFGSVLAHDRLGRRLILIVVTLVTFAVMALSAQGTMGLWFQRNVLLRQVAWPQANLLRVEGLGNGRLIVPRGEDITITAVVVEGYEAPRQTFIEFENESGRNGRQQLPAVGQSPVRYSHTFEEVSGSLRCRVVGGDAQTEEFLIEAVDRPRIDQVQLRVTPPAYTKLDAFDLREGQTVAEMLEGSVLQIIARTNKPIVEARLQRQQRDGEVITRPTQFDGTQMRIEDQPLETSSYYFSLIDESGLGNGSQRVPPVRITARLLADKPPKVALKLDGVGEMVTTEAVLPLEAEYSDQYGLASASLVHEISQGEGEPKTNVEPITDFEPGTQSLRRSIYFGVSEHGLIEGDRFVLLARASDLDDIPEPNVGESTEIALRVVSREHLLAELNRREQEHRHDLERLLRQQEELYDALLKLATKGGDIPNIGQQWARLARRQRDYASRMNMLRLRFEQVLSELRINRLSSPAAERRLGENVIEPMGELSRVMMPSAAEAIDTLARAFDEDAMRLARQRQEEIIDAMNRILGGLIKWEGFSEAITLLRDVIKMQADLTEDTEKQIEAELFGPIEPENDESP